MHSLSLAIPAKTLTFNQNQLLTVKKQSGGVYSAGGSGVQH